MNHLYFIIIFKNIWNIKKYPFQHILSTGKNKKIKSFHTWLFHCFVCSKTSRKRAPRQVNTIHSFLPLFCWICKIVPGQLMVFMCNEAFFWLEVTRSQNISSVLEKDEELSKIEDSEFYFFEFCRWFVLSIFWWLKWLWHKSQEGIFLSIGKPRTIFTGRKKLNFLIRMLQTHGNKSRLC